MPLRRCLREPIPEIELAARRLDDAVSADLRGEPDNAARLFEQANDNSVREWLESLWGKFNKYNTPRRILTKPGLLSKGRRATPGKPTARTVAAVHQRDGHYCRFCQIPVISAKIRDKIRQLYPSAVPWGNTNLSQHAGFQCMWAQYDHILPHSRGGDSNLANIYLTCAACNFGRKELLLEELDLAHPSLYPPRQGNWDGLQRFRKA